MKIIIPREAVLGSVLDDLYKSSAAIRDYADSNWGRFSTIVRAVIKPFLSVFKEAKLKRREDYITLYQNVYRLPDDRFSEYLREFEDRHKKSMQQLRDVLTQKGSFTRKINKYLTSDEQQLLKDPLSISIAALIGCFCEAVRENKSDTDIYFYAGGSSLSQHRQLINVPPPHNEENIEAHHSSMLSF